MAAVFTAALVLSGCMLEFGSVTAPGFCKPPACTTLTLTGGVVGTPITGNLQMSLSIFELAGHASMSDFKGSVHELLTLAGSAATGMTGQYRVSGGTGAYVGATGTGTWTLEWTGSGTASVTMIGTFQVPATASAASTRKRTFKMRATIQTASVCNATSKGRRSSERVRNCRRVALDKLLR